MRLLPAAACLGILLSGCPSSFIEADIRNQSQQPIKLIEVDYPNASFGVGSLAPGGTFHYRFKLQGSGELKIEFTDPAGKLHSATGPAVKEGQAGPLAITIDAAGQVHWHL